MITISLNLSKIPKEKIKKGNDGNLYINLILSERKEVSKFGETHALMISKTKEEREAKEPTIYVGGGKEYKQNNAITPEKIDEMPPVDDADDLPF